ncbi:MAG: replicative DNA helicase [Clostridiales bacterium]|nr:replicative DNA helicase [Clostridiales bacterium]
MANNSTNEKRIHPNVKGKIMPQNNEAEQAVLCCVLIDEYVQGEILASLKAEDFYSHAHQMIFEAMSSVYGNNMPIDIITLVQELEKQGNMEAVGGINYISSLSNVLPSAANYAHYLEIVRANKLRRSLIDVANKVATVAYSGEENAMEYAERQIFGLGEGNTRRELRPISDAASEAIERMELVERDPLFFRGIPTGFKRLDNLLNGFQSGDLIIIAARPGQGKTSIGMNFIQAAAFSERTTETGKKVPISAAVFSLEMPAVQLARRMLCSVAKVDMTKANSGHLGDAEWQRMMLAKTKLDKANIFVDDTSATTPVDIISKCRKLKRERGLDIVMIDYLQLMSPSKRVENRQQEISDITRNLKIAAKELNVPILLLSQLSRDVEKRTNKTPVMSDLRESGAIEQDADIIMFLYREHTDADKNVTEEERDAVQLIVAKHRNGQTDTIDLRWRGSHVSFEERDANIAPPASAQADASEDADEGGTVQSRSVEELLSISPSADEPLF